MNTDERGLLDSLTERVLEKVYQRALLTELRLRGIRATAEVSFAVTYKGHSVGEYFADILVEDVLVIELKCVDRFTNEHTAQWVHSTIGVHQR